MVIFYTVVIISPLLQRRMSSFNLYFIKVISIGGLPFSEEKWRSGRGQRGSEGGLEYEEGEEITFRI